MYTRRSQRENDRGFSAVEVVVWVALFIVVMMAIALSIVYFYRTNSGSINEATAIANAQHGLDDMMTTLREAGYSSNGAYPIISMAQNDIKFYAAVPGQTFVEEVEYTVATTSLSSATSSDSLYRGVIVPVGDPPSYAGSFASTTVANYVQNLAVGTSTFGYYDGSGNKITDYTQIQNLRYVTVDLIVNVDPTRPHTVEMRSSAALRNLIGH